MRKVLVAVTLLAMCSCTGSATRLGIAGQEALNKREYQKAILLLTEAIAAGGLSSEELFFVYANRGTAYLDQPQHQYQQAVADFDKALTFRSSPEHEKDVLVTRGYALAGLGDYSRALDDVEAALMINPNDASTISARGMIRYHKKDVVGALNDFEAALKLNPNYYQAKLMRNVALSSMGRKTIPIE